MARQKNPTALFDVIHSAKKPPKPSPSAAIPTPKWWGKNKTLPKPAPQTAAAESTENVGKQRSWLSAAKKSGALPASVPLQAPVHSPVLPAVSQTTTQSSPPEPPSRQVPEHGLEYWPSTSSESPAVEQLEMQPAAPPEPAVSQPKPRFIDRFKNQEPKQKITRQEITDPVAVQIVSFEPAEDSPAALLAQEVPAPEVKSDRPPARLRDDRDSFMRVDSAAGDIRFRMSYAFVVAIAFSLLMAFVIVFLVGERAGQQALNDDPNPSVAQPAPAAHNTGMMAAVGPTAPAGVPSIDTPAKYNGNPLSADNAAVNADASNSGATNTGPVNTDPVQPDVLSIPQHAPRPAPVLTAHSPAAEPLPIKKTRDIGMMYVVVQSYPEQELAQKACDFMNSSGIPCTLVPGPSGWAPSDWFSVVGLQPFNKHDPALPDYERSVRALGVKFTTRAIDQFQPQAYTWRADSDASTQ